MSGDRADDQGAGPGKPLSPTASPMAGEDPGRNGQIAANTRPLRFRKKPVVIEAVQLTERVEIPTLEGTMIGNPGDWLITGVKGEQYPCRDDIFCATYEPVEQPQPAALPDHECG